MDKLTLHQLTHTSQNQSALHSHQTKEKGKAKVTTYPVVVTTDHMTTTEIKGPKLLAETTKKKQPITIYSVQKIYPQKRENFICPYHILIGKCFLTLEL